MKGRRILISALKGAVFVGKGGLEKYAEVGAREKPQLQEIPDVDESGKKKCPSIEDQGSAAWAVTTISRPAQVNKGVTVST